MGASAARGCLDSLIKAELSPLWRVWRVEGLGFRVWGSGFREGLGLGFRASGFRITMITSPHTNNGD